MLLWFRLPSQAATLVSPRNPKGGDTGERLGMAGQVSYRHWSDS